MLMLGPRRRSLLLREFMLSRLVSDVCRRRAAHGVGLLVGGRALGHVGRSSDARPIRNMPLVRPTSC